jgi:hypothetical protein
MLFFYPVSLPRAVGHKIWASGVRCPRSDLPTKNHAGGAHLGTTAGPAGTSVGCGSNMSTAVPALLHVAKTGSGCGRTASVILLMELCCALMLPGAPHAMATNDLIGINLLEEGIDSLLARLGYSYSPDE